MFTSVALIAIAASPAVTSTRLFCRYTGVEIIACDESRVPAQAQVREADCCLKRTFHAIDPTRTLTDDRPRVAARAVVATIGIPEVRLAAAAPLARPCPAGGAGPPTFLTNRALLI